MIKYQVLLVCFFSTFFYTTLLTNQELNQQLSIPTTQLTQHLTQQRMAPYQENGRFYNYKGEHPGSHLNWFQEVAIYCTAVLQRCLQINSRNPAFSHKKSWRVSGKPRIEQKDLTITWIGHASFLIQIGGVNILTDPIFGNAFPLIYTRILEPGINLHDLPPIDIVLISHNHLDHMDEATLKYLEKANENITFLVPFGDKAWFDNRGFRQVIESHWWDKHTFVNQDGTTHQFTFLPARHWSHRYLFSKKDINLSLWGSWMLEHNNQTIYFAGDTAFSHHFKEIGDAFENIDVALMPIGPCEYRCWMHTTHISPEEAGQGFLDLKAKHFIPMHWGTFYFGVDHFTTPIERMALWWSSKNKVLSDKELHFVKMGEEVTPLA